MKWGRAEHHLGLLLQLNRNHNSEFPGSQSKNGNGGVGSVAVLEPVIKTGEICQIQVTFPLCQSFRSRVRAKAQVLGD